jgi:hypothetical protein
VNESSGAPKLTFCLALMVSVFTTVYLGDRPTRAKPKWWTTHALTKALPWDNPPNERSQPAEIAAARNEFEPFQIILRTDEKDHRVLDANPTDLQGPDGAKISRENVRIYVERYITLKRTSTGSTTSAEWPDPLIPRIDQYFGERRNSFPLNLSKGRNQPLWVEIYVPPDTSPGDYRGQIEITTDGAGVTVIPFSVHVWEFSLPSTATYKTSFGLAGAAALKQHRGKYTNDEDLEAITRLYAKAMLWHRVSFHGGTFHPPEVQFQGDAARIDWTRYDNEIAPFLNGTVFSKGEPLFGAKLTSVDLRTSNKADTDPKKVEYWKQWVRHFELNGWLDRLFFYVQDEPPLKQLPKVNGLAELAHQADPRLRTLVTTSFEENLADSIDIWTPLINCTQPKSGFADYCEHSASRDAYTRAIQQGKELWWYQSCASHGCKEGDDEYFRGWPNYVVDAPSIANRIMPWLSWKYAVAGELYYNVIEANDPWNDIYLFGGNGDGTLFYPGKPELIGGTKDIPVESIRLKLIREGIEDYEYMAMLAAQGRSRWTDEQVSTIVRSAFDWQHEPQQLYAARKLLGETLEMVTRQSSE